MKLFAVTLIALFSSAAFAANQSKYTSVHENACVTIEDSKLNPNSEIDYYTGYCKGFNEYAVVISGSDLRYNLSLLYQGNEVKFPAPQGFYGPGSNNIEWRGTVNKDGSLTQFHSLIYRLNIEYVGANGNSVQEDHLYVVRLAGLKSCVIGDIGPVANMNVEARKIADNLALTCP